MGDTGQRYVRRIATRMIAALVAGSASAVVQLDSLQGMPALRMRVGIHTGPVVAGIVGVKKFQYDIWGDTVNTAGRMESSGEAGKVNISEATYMAIQDDRSFRFTPRGLMSAKGKGEVAMWFVERG